MHNITLICTRHESLGKCNSDELYQIIEGIRPEVIFEEMPPSFFNDFHLYNIRSNLESETIKRYAEHYQIEQVTVDSDDIPSDEFFKEYKYMVDKIGGRSDKNGFAYRNLIDVNRDYIWEFGFNYLNSVHSDKINEGIYKSIKNGLDKINNDKFFKTYELWKKTHEKREDKMLENIYKYSETHNYNTAIFTIGVAHRNSIIKKILKLQKNEDVKLNWSFI